MIANNAARLDIDLQKAGLAKVPSASAFDPKRTSGHPVPSAGLSRWPPRSRATYTIWGEMQRGLAKTVEDNIGQRSTSVNARSEQVSTAPTDKDLANLYSESVSNGLRAQVIAARANFLNALPNEMPAARRAISGARDEAENLHDIGAMSDAVFASLLRLLPITERFDSDGMRMGNPL